MEGDARGSSRNCGGDRVIIQERVQAAAAQSIPLRIAGRATWLGAGRPVAATQTVSLADHSGVVDYVPNDLTITIRSGTSLGDLARVIDDEGQWWPVNPFGSDDGSIGATVATASSGPFAHGFGTVRDLVLGVEVITGEGKIIRGGGRVVKNVAGFDLVRLMTGSWGTLGAISELTLRLYAKPSHRATMAMEAPTDARRLAERFRALLDAPVIPFGLELINDNLSQHIGLPRRQMILVEFGGNSAAVSAQRDAFRKIGAAIEAPTGCWDQLRVAASGTNTVFRLSGLPVGLATRWNLANTILEDSADVLIHASIGRGIVRCVVPNALSSAAIEKLVSAKTNHTLILESVPADLWKKISPSAIADRLSQSVRRAFDPMGILNPGILGPVN
ncbi:MAG: FAD-binding protein [Gemmatimonadaceae bacterium]